MYITMIDESSGEQVQVRHEIQQRKMKSGLPVAPLPLYFIAGDDEPLESLSENRFTSRLLGKTLRFPDD